MPVRPFCLPRSFFPQLFRHVAVLLASGLLMRSPAKSQPVPAMPRRYSQAQVANQFLRAVLRAEHAAAYVRLAPEVRRAVSPAAFATATQPMRKAGRGAAPLELYKLGVRLGDGGTSRLFYSFAFAADSALSQPAVLFEVTFRDTAARGVLGFGLARELRRVMPKVGAKSVHQ